MDRHKYRISFVLEFVTITLKFRDKTGEADDEF
jgi:hypothetical protein